MLPAHPRYEHFEPPCPVPLDGIRYISGRGGQKGRSRPDVRSHYAYTNGPSRYRLYPRRGRTVIIVAPKSPAQVLVGGGGKGERTNPITPRDRRVGVRRIRRHINVYGGREEKKKKIKIRIIRVGSRTWFVPYLSYVCIYNVGRVRRVQRRGDPREIE